MITEGGKTIRKCVKYFAGADAIQHIAEEVRHQIHEFKPLVPLIRTFKNPGLRQRHLEAISEVCGTSCDAGHAKSMLVHAISVFAFASRIQYCGQGQSVIQEATGSRNQ
jgi:hypothetical protein